MRVVVALDFRFRKTPDGAIWTDTGYDLNFWRRYLEVFDSVRIVARARPAPSAAGVWKRVDGERVSFHAAPDYLGPLQYIRQRTAVRDAVRRAIGDDDAVILRVPGQIANCLAAQLIRKRRPYGVEVVGDPASAFRSGAVQHPLRRFFGWWFTAHLLGQCRSATAAAYVAGVLEKLYPTKGRAFHISDVELPPEAFRSQPKSDEERSGGMTWITIASLAQMYKGVDLLIGALRQFPGVRLRIIGDGKHRAELAALARSGGVADRIDFLGQLPAGDAVRCELDRADLFVLPSRTEGLPRALLEAMARRLPCVASSVGGIPELLATEDLVPPGDAGALARHIRQIVGDPARLAGMAERNFRKASEYRDAALLPRRREFYQYIREATESRISAGAKLCVSSTS